MRWRSRWRRLWRSRSRSRPGVSTDPAGRSTVELGTGPQLSPHRSQSGAISLSSRMGRGSLRVPVYAADSSPPAPLRSSCNSASGTRLVMSPQWIQTDIPSCFHSNGSVRRPSSKWTANSNRCIEDTLKPLPALTRHFDSSVRYWLDTPTSQRAWHFASPLSINPVY